MGVRINGVWHEEVADPGTGGTDSGNGRNYDSAASYNQAAGSTTFSGGTNTTIGGGGGGGGGAPAAPAAPGAPTVTQNPGSYSVGGGGMPTITGPGSAPAALVQAVQDYFNATQTGNKAAADEAIRQFNINYELTKASVTGVYQGSATQAALKQAADIAAQQAALTGTFNGQPTLAAEKQASDLAEQNYRQGITTAGLTGTYNGSETQQAQAQRVAQALAQAGLIGFDANGNATVAEQQLGLDALKAQSAMQNDPFRQQQYLYGLGQGGYSRAIDAMNGATGFLNNNGMGPSAAGTNQLGYLGGVVGGYANGLGGFNGNADPSGMSIMGTGMDTYNASLNALPGSANQIVGRNYLKADQATRNFITSGMSAKTGLDQSTIDEQIKRTMPGFKAPAFGMSRI